MKSNLPTLSFTIVLHFFPLTYTYLFSFIYSTINFRYNGLLWYKLYISHDKAKPA